MGAGQGHVVSIVAFRGAAGAAVPELEPSIELASKFYEAVIGDTTYRICGVTDREADGGTIT
jgi:hypothetical protein